MNYQSFRPAAANSSTADWRYHSSDDKLMEPTDDDYGYELRAGRGGFNPNYPTSSNAPKPLHESDRWKPSYSIEFQNPPNRANPNPSPLEDEEPDGAPIGARYPMEGIHSRRVEPRYPGELASAVVGDPVPILPTRRLISTACQTEFNASIALLLSGSPEPRGPKVFFRVVYEDKVLLYKLSCDCVFKVLFASVNVKADFVWHGIVLDESMCPADYNMLPGEQNTVTIHVVKNIGRNTHAEEIAMNDLARSLGFRLRLREEQNTRLEEELDQLRAQVATLTKEMEMVASRSENKIRELQITSRQAEAARKQAVEAAEHLDRELDAVRRQLVSLRGQMGKGSTEGLAGSGSGLLATNLGANNNKATNSGKASYLFDLPGSSAAGTLRPSQQGAATAPPLKHAWEEVPIPTIVDRSHPAPNPYSYPHRGGGAAGISATASDKPESTPTPTGRIVSKPATGKPGAVNGAGDGQPRSTQMQDLRRSIESWQKKQGENVKGGASQRDKPNSSAEPPPSIRGGTPTGTLKQAPLKSTPQPEASPIPHQRDANESQGQSGAEEADVQWIPEDAPPRTRSDADRDAEDDRAGSPEVSVSGRPKGNSSGGPSTPTTFEATGKPAPRYREEDRRIAPLATSLDVKVILMDETTQKETALAPVTVLAGEPNTVGSVIRQLLQRDPTCVPPVNQCMLCLQPAATPGEYKVLTAAEAPTTVIHPRDVLFIAKMNVATMEA